MKRKYFIYWKAQNVDGNIVMDIDWSKVCLKNVIKDIIDSLNEEDSTLGFKNISIPFIVEIK